MLEKGLKGSQSVLVTEENTAAKVGSGLLPVFATPAMIALMEATCAQSVASELEEGCSTVGTHLDVKHSAATPVGMTVKCESELLEVDRRRLVFHVTAWDDAGLIGEGTHERFIVNNEKFMSKTQSKLG